MKQLKAVSVIGHFGNSKLLLNGQTVKTKIITDELYKQLGSDEVLKLDTAGGKSILLKAPFQCLKALKTAKNVIIFPAHNGVRVYVPLLSFFRKFFKNRKLHYVVIGGWLPEFLQKRKRLAKQLKRFDGIYVETNTMKNALEKQGFTNIFVMPNCKDLKILKPEELVYPTGEPYKLCTFSRVMKEKGIEDAVNAVKEIGNGAFNNCRKLGNITVPASVKKIRSNAFYDCLAMKKITILNSKTVIEKEAIGYNFNSGKNKTFVIAGKKGSTAQTYAKKYGFRFLNNTAAVKTAKMTGVPKTKTILRGKTYTIQAVTVPYYSDEKILFRSSDRRIATVNSNGVVKGIRKGTAVITVQSGAKKLNCKVTVK